VERSTADARQLSRRTRRDGASAPHSHVARHVGREASDEVARLMEYRPEGDPSADPFASIYGLD
jgi:hypothetical protein